MGVGGVSFGGEGYLFSLWLTKSDTNRLVLHHLPRPGYTAAVNHSQLHKSKAPCGPITREVDQVLELD